MDDYLKLGGSLLGHGTYSTVSRAIQRSTGRMVALKKVKSRMDEGISCSALREVKLLRELQQGGDSSAGGGSADGCHASPGASPHVIQLLDVFCHKQKLLMVFECMETDLGNVIRNHVLNAHQIKSLLLQLLRGLACIHKAGIAHRDMKPDNLLLSADGCLKIADLGVARFMPPLESQLQREKKGPALPRQQHQHHCYYHHHHQHQQHQMHHHQHSHGHPLAQHHLHQHPHQHLCGQGAGGVAHDGALSGCTSGAQCPPLSPCISAGGGPPPMSPSCVDAWGWLDDSHSRLCRGGCQNGHNSSSCSVRSGCAGGCVSPAYGHHAHLMVPANLIGTQEGGEEPLEAPGGAAQMLQPCPSPTRLYTNQVSSRWYRPPELLFGATHYDGMAVDVWGVGCVFAELLLGRVWFQGGTDMEQLNLIFSTLGVPNEAMWPGVSQLKTYVPFREKEVPPLSASFQGCPAASAEALDLLAGLMSLNPSKRLTAEQALAHPYFRDAPPEPTIGPLHQLQQVKAPIKPAHAHLPSAMLSASHRKRCIRWASVLDSPALDHHAEAPLGSHTRIQHVEEVWPDAPMGEGEEEPEEVLPEGCAPAVHDGDACTQRGEDAAPTGMEVAGGVSAAARARRRRSLPLRPHQDRLLGGVPQPPFFGSLPLGDASHTNARPPCQPVFADPPSCEQAACMTGGQSMVCGSATISRAGSVPTSEAGSLALSLAPTSAGFPGSGFKRPRRLFESDSKPPPPSHSHAAGSTCGKRWSDTQAGRRSSENGDGMHTDSSGFAQGSSPSSAEGGRRWKRRLTMGSNEHHRCGRDDILSAAPTPLPPPNFVGMTSSHPTPPSTTPPTPSPMNLTVTRTLGHALGAPPSPFCHAPGSHQPTPAASCSAAGHLACLEDEPMPLSQDVLEYTHTVAPERTAQAVCTPQVSTLGGAFGSQQLVCTELCAGASPPGGGDMDMEGAADAQGSTLLQASSPVLQPQLDGACSSGLVERTGSTPLHAAHALSLCGVPAAAPPAAAGKPPLAGNASQAAARPGSDCGGVCKLPYTARVVAKEGEGSDAGIVGEAVDGMGPSLGLPGAHGGAPFSHPIERDKKLEGTSFEGQERDAGAASAFSLAATAAAAAAGSIRHGQQHWEQHGEQQHGRQRMQKEEQQQQQHGQQRGWVWDGHREGVFCAGVAIEGEHSSIPVTAPTPDLFCPGSLHVRCWSNRGREGAVCEGMGGDAAGLQQQYLQGYSPNGNIRPLPTLLASQGAGVSAHQQQQQHGSNVFSAPMQVQVATPGLHCEQQLQQQHGSNVFSAPMQVQVATPGLHCEQHQQQQLYDNDATCAHIQVHMATPSMTLPPTQTHGMTPSGVTAPMAMASLRGGTPTGISLPLACKLSTEDEGRRMSVGPTLLDDRLRQAAGSVGSLVDLAVCPPAAPNTMQSQPVPGNTPTARFSGHALHCVGVREGEIDGAQVLAPGLSDQGHAAMGASNGSECDVARDEGDECKQEASSVAGAAAGAWVLMESVLEEGVRGVGLPLGGPHVSVQEGQDEGGARGRGGRGGGRKRRGVGPSRSGCAAHGSLGTTDLQRQQQQQQQQLLALSSTHAQGHRSDHSHHPHLHRYVPLSPASQNQHVPQHQPTQHQKQQQQQQQRQQLPIKHRLHLRSAENTRSEHALPQQVAHKRKQGHIQSGSVPLNLQRARSTDENQA